MNENDFLSWTEKLQEHRRMRRERIDHAIREKSGDFKRNDLVQISVKSLEKILPDWWGLEQKNLPHVVLDDIPQEIERLKGELKSLLSMELTAIDSDWQYVREQLSWSQDLTQLDWVEIEKFSEQVQQEYDIKIDFAPNELKKSQGSLGFQSVKSPKGPLSLSSTGGKPSKKSVAMAFIIGAALGLLPGYYLWDQLKTIRNASDDDIAKLRQEKKDLEDGFAVYQRTFTDLADGKKKTIPQLEALIAPIHKTFQERRARANREFEAERAAIQKQKLPENEREGELLKLKDRQRDVMARLDAREKSELEAYQKELTALNALVGRQ